MIEVNASFRSVEASVTQVKTYSERNALAVRAEGDRPQSSLLNPQEKQIVDEVGISAEALQKFEDAKLLADQLQDYMDYLNGAGKSNLIQITANDNEPDVVIEGQSTKLAASVTAVTYKEETLDINAKFDDSGNLQELSIDKQSITAEYVKAELITEQRQFYIAA